MPNEFYKNLGIVALVVYWIVTLSVLYRFWGHKGMSISRHAATNRQSYLTMAVMQTFTLPALIIFVCKWLAPTFALPVLFSILFGLSMTLFAVAAWVPDTEGLKYKLHGFLAQAATILGVAAVTLLIVAPTISPVVRSIITVNFVLMVGIITSTKLSARFKDQTLFMQILMYLLFDSILLLTIYFGM